MIKNIVVEVSGTERDEAPLAHAARIAEMFAAHVTAVLSHTLPETVAFTEPSASIVLKEMWEESSRQADLRMKQLSPRLAKLGVSHELRRHDVFAGRAGRELAAEVRLADLFVGSLRYEMDTRSAGVAEAVLLGSGRGCLFVPPGKPAPNAYSTCLVAWNGSRESARAVAEALPLLSSAETVIVAIVEEGASEQAGVAAGTDIGCYLSRHGVEAEVRTVAGWHDAGEAIVNEAKMIGAQMIVMGGYGHSRLREWVLGGATRHVLTEADVPVLMAH